MNPALEKRLAECVTLPSLPGVALRIIELGRDPNAGHAEVAKVISMDPALTAKLLKISNSSLYALRRKVENLKQALMMLGLNAVFTLALSFSLVRSLRTSERKAMDHELYWRRSILAAITSRALGERLKLAGVEELFLAGLLQDIGRLVLDRVMSQEYGRVVATARTHEEIRAAEIRELGADHAEVGAWIMEKWNLPEYLRRAVLYSHKTDADPSSNEEELFQGCVAVSGWIADIWLREDGDVASQEAAVVAENLLGMDKDALGEVLDAVSVALPEISLLFDIELVEPRRIRSILEQAKEVLMIRSLKMVEEASQTRGQTEFLQIRNRALEEQVRRDGLTGLYNRTYLEQVLREEFIGATERGWPLSVAFLDLDRFKQINDTYGHQVGDRVLISVAHHLASLVRQTDLLARYGGEEFMIVMPGTNSAAAQVLLERLLTEVASQPHGSNNGQKIHVTLSIGMATHMEKRRFESLEDLIRGADRAVYTAKREGRNRLVVYEA